MKLYQHILLKGS